MLIETTFYCSYVNLSVLTVRVDTIWYTASCTKSVHFSASLAELALKSANDGNADDAEANVVNDDAGAFN